MSALRFRVVFFSPRTNTQAILNHLFAKYPTRVGKIGNYEHCAFVSPGIGQFKPSAGANPSIGTVGDLEFVEEDRVEFIVHDEGQKEQLKHVIGELRKVHPYEEVAADVYKLEDI